MKTAYFTIAAWNYLHFARALAASLHPFKGDAELILAVADTERDDIGPDRFPEFDRLITFADLQRPDRAAMAFRYDVMELSTAIKPSVFLRLFAQGYDRVVYLDPDIVAFRRFDEVFAAFDAGASTVLTPHSLAPVTATERPNDLTFLQAGTYNLGFMALAKTDGVLETLRWWEQHLRTQCVSDRLGDGIFVDQKFVDLWPAYCAGTHILRDPTYNVAYWNLDTRRLDFDGNNFRVEGRPLAFYHFSGIDPSDRTVLSRHQRRWSLDNSPALRRLFDTYHERLTELGAAVFSQVEYGFGRFADGTPIPRVARIYFRTMLEPFGGDPARDLPALLNAAAPLQPSMDVITRMAHALWLQQPDLQRQFDLSSAAGQASFADWFIAAGAHGAGIPTAFVEPVRSRLAAIQGQGGLYGASHRGMTGSLARATFQALMKLRPHIAWLYRPIPPELRRRLIDWLLQTAWRRRSPSTPPVVLAPGLSLIGYPFAEIGVGEAMRSLANAAIAGGTSIDVVNFDLEAQLPGKDFSLAGHVAASPGKAVNVFCVNADTIEHTLRSMGPAVTRGRHNILRPFWELARLHPDWTKALSGIDEVWAPTAFVGNAFAAACNRPVMHIPVAISVPPGITADRAAFGIPPGATTFLFAFDFSSYPARKNPEAVLEAYRRAFASDRRANVALVIKTRGTSPKKEQVMAAIRAMAAADPRIVVMDRLLDRMQMHRLTASADVFVSLHRSEGFGLGLAEAMAMGKAVIGSDFSGNRDFLTTDTGFPIACRSIPVGRDDYPFYIEGQFWADPDVDQAAAVMQRLAEDPSQITDIGAKARAFIETVHSPSAVGRIIAARLAEIEGR